VEVSLALETPRASSVAAMPRAHPWFNVRAAAPRIIAVVLYAVAMAYVESAAVLYLRTIYGGVDPVGPRHSVFSPLPDFVAIEIGREVATIIMLATVGYLAAATPAGRIGAFAAAIGVWDIFYYVFLWLFSGWPASPLAPDVLFLLPLPWWGPVLAPILLAAVIAAAGTAAMARELGDGVPALRVQDVVAILVGGAVCLLAFMANALAALPDGLYAAFSVRGGPFLWPMFLIGVAVGAFGLLRALVRVAP
jgi:hypothetical protein